MVDDVVRCPGDLVVQARHMNLGKVGPVKAQTVLDRCTDVTERQRALVRAQDSVRGEPVSPGFVVCLPDRGWRVGAVANLGEVAGSDAVTEVRIVVPEVQRLA